MRRSYDTFFMSNRDWYEIKNGVRIIKDDAPEEAQKSYDTYLDYYGITREQLPELINAPIEIE